ncbi:MAG: efflux RND transporter periplasmic adaptor subunit [Nitrospira sp.]|nr:MAG: efflux RND transporter periplasmic adaptor subunit [Nitrospira sp.]
MHPSRINSSPYCAMALAVVSLSLAGCLESQAEQHHEKQRTIVVTSPEVKDVVSTQEYICQIHSRRHIEVCALNSGYLEEIRVQEGQAVKQGDLMFTILPTLYQAKLASEEAEAQLAQIELTNTKRLLQQNVVSPQEVALAEAKLAKAKANVTLARTELNFTNITAPFDGIIDRLHRQQGSLIEEGDMLTTLSDNTVMWVYFNVPEARYLEYRARFDQEKASKADAAGNQDEGSEELQIELVLANGQKFPQAGKISAIEADFNNETGNIAFRADFPNPDILLRHGQTGNVLIHRVVHDAIVIPQRSTFEILDKRYVYLVGEDGVVHQREIIVGNEMEDIFVIRTGLSASDKIVLEGVRQVRDGQKVEVEFLKPEEALNNLKYHAE